MCREATVRHGVRVRLLDGVGEHQGLVRRQRDLAIDGRLTDFLFAIVNEKNNEIVIELVKELLCKKALVYLTDSIKIYFSNDACNSKECYCACRAIFDFEMKRFNPDVVLAFGEVATKAAALQSFNLRFVANAVSDNPIQFPKCQVWSLVHPSKRTLSKVMEELDVDTDATVGNRTQYVLTNYYKKVIEQIFGIDKLEKKH